MAEIRTLEEVRDEGAVRRARDYRRSGLVGLVLLVAGGLVGVFGITSTTVTAVSNGYELRVTHARSTRAGIAAPLHLEVRHPGGFAGPVTLQVQESLLERFDFQNFYPNPSKETATGDFLVYEFDPPAGDVLRISLDARTSPDQNGSWGRYVVRLPTGGSTAAELSFRMLVVP